MQEGASQVVTLHDEIPAYHAGSCFSSGHFGRRNASIPCRELPLRWSVCRTPRGAPERPRAPQNTPERPKAPQSARPRARQSTLERANAPRARQNAPQRPRAPHNAPKHPREPQPSPDSPKQLGQSQIALGRSGLQNCTSKYSAPLQKIAFWASSRQRPSQPPKGSWSPSAQNNIF